MSRGKIHSQPRQRCEHPNLSGNGSTQAVPVQLPTTNRSPQSKLTQKTPPKRWQEAKFTHNQDNNVSIPTSVGMVPLRLLLFNVLQQKKHRVNVTEIPPKDDKIHSQPGQSFEHPNLSRNGSTQAVLTHWPTAKKFTEKMPQKTPKKRTRGKIHSQ